MTTEAPPRIRPGWVWGIRDLASVFTNLGVVGVITLLFSVGVGLMLSAAILAYVWGLYRRGALG